MIGELRDRGCNAGGYRLAGDTLAQLCCRHLYADDRMIVAWRAHHHAVVIAIGPRSASELADALKRVERVRRRSR